MIGSERGLFGDEGELGKSGEDGLSRGEGGRGELLEGESVGGGEGRGETSDSMGHVGDKDVEMVIRSDNELTLDSTDELSTLSPDFTDVSSMRSSSEADCRERELLMGAKNRARKIQLDSGGRPTSLEFLMEHDGDELELEDEVFQEESVEDMRKMARARQEGYRTKSFEKKIHEFSL